MLFLYCFREQSTSKSVMTASVPEAERELVKKNQQPNTEMVIQQLCSEVTEQMLNEAKSELQVLTHSRSTFNKEFPSSNITTHCSKIYMAIKMPSSCTYVT